MRMFIRYIIAIMVGSALCSAPSLAQSIEISLKQAGEMRLNRADVQIGDVFDVHAANPKTAKQLSALLLVRFRNPGHSQNIYEFHVTRILNEAGYAEVQMTDEFPVEIESRAAIIPLEKLTRLIDNYLAKNSTAEITWDYTREPELAIFPGDEYELRLSHSGEILPGRVALRTELQNGEYSSQSSIMVNVRMHRRVLVATEKLTRGMTLSDKNTRYEKTELDIYQARYAISNENLNDIEVVRDIEPGEPVLSNMIQRVEVVQTGDNVRLYVDMGKLRVESLGTAIESGGVSEKIKVRESRSGNIVVGTIVDNQTIKISPQENL
ncbi:MAG: flagellar basal body P-ring formation protein FlgA [Candidatus Marinimicrobia bacterium]|nr:flagellar basal body P-ring formation protein FlgA [Candidatus Neomarinimicrobiota bacterium]